MLLYDKPECPFCWKVRIALREADLTCSLIDSNLPESRSLWQSLTPKKTVPVLVDESLVIYESNVILEFIADTTGYLMPGHAASRTVPRLINLYSDTVLGSALREIVFEKREKPESEWDSEKIQAGTLAFQKSLYYLSEILGERDFFGDNYSIAECALTARFGLAEAYGVVIPEEFPNLIRWYSSVKLRKSFDATKPAFAGTKKSYDSTKST